MNHFNYKIAGLMACATMIVACSQEPVEETAPGFAAESSAEEIATAAITSDLMRGIVREISDDKYEGRGPGSRGDVAAREFLIGEMQSLGLEPGAANGSWEQTFELVGITADQPPEWTFVNDTGAMTLKQWDDFIVSSGVQSNRAEVTSAEVVFVGYAIEAPEYHWNDFKDHDLDGKILMIMNNDPDWDPDLFAGETRLWYGRWD
ncbi:MAG: hypothetical protein P8M18_01595, partial [Woeseiaceae bacterium]|nr:hypothetical protein [Woeseiaceae bacterium]